MEDRRLKITGVIDNTKIVIAEDKKKEYQKAFDSLQTSLGTFEYARQNNLEINVGLAQNSFSVAIRRLAEMASIYGVIGVEQKRINELQQDCRELHDENRELRSQLGQKVSYEDNRECVKNIIESIRHWWADTPITGYMRDIKINDYGAFEAELRFEIGYGRHWTTEKTDFKEAIVKATNFGFQLVNSDDEESNDDNYPSATTENFSLIENIAKEIGGYVYDYDIDKTNKKDLLYISTAKILIRDYTKLENKINGYN